MNPIDSNNFKGAIDPTKYAVPKTSTNHQAVQTGAVNTNSNAIEKKGKKPPEILQIATKETRKQELAKISTLIANGAYTVDMGRLAQAMIDKHLVK